MGTAKPQGEALPILPDRHPAQKAENWRSDWMSCMFALQVCLISRERHTPGQIINKLRQAEVAIGSAGLCRLRKH